MCCCYCCDFCAVIVVLCCCICSDFCVVTFMLIFVLLLLVRFLCCYCCGGLCYADIVGVVFVWLSLSVVF